MKKLTVILASLLLLSQAAGQAARRETVNLDFGWYFHKGDIEAGETAAFSGWRQLNIPHDFSIEGPYSEDNPAVKQQGYLPVGIGWYARTIEWNPDWKGRRVNIVFDGAHNPEAVDALTKSFPSFTNGKTVHVLFAAFRDKNIAVELPLLGTYSADITLTTFDHPRARGEMDYFLYMGDYPYVENYQDALKDLEEKYPDDLILVTGSIAFAALVRKFVMEGKA